MLISATKLKLVVAFYMLPRGKHIEINRLNYQCANVLLSCYPDLIGEVKRLNEGSELEIVILRLALRTKKLAKGELNSTNLCVISHTCLPIIGIFLPLSTPI